MNASYGQIGGEVAAECVDSSILARLCGRIREIRSGIADEASRLQNINDRLFGQRVEKEGSGTSPPKPVPNGAMGEIDEALDGVNAQLAWLNSEINRLQELA